MIFTQQSNENLRDIFVSEVTKVFGNCINFLDFLDNEDFGPSFDFVKSSGEEVYLIDRNTGNFVNWYKMTHIGRDIHINFDPSMLFEFLTKCKNSGCYDEEDL